MAKESELSSLQKTWEGFKAQDEQKNDLVQSLFAIIEDLKIRVSETEDELLDKKDVVKALRGQIEVANGQVKTMQREKEKHVYAMVLIDGDSIPFKDDLVRQGIEGGQKAAAMLKQALHEKLLSWDPDLPPHMEIVCRIYASFSGMGRVYKEAELITDITAFYDFVRGFNKADPTFDYVDAGNGKECADMKIKAVFKSSLADVHCRHIIFGGSTDNGYARILDPVAQGSPGSEKITLLEGPRFASELERIKDRFRTVSFENVFRSQKIASVKTAPTATSPAPWADLAKRVVKAPSPTMIYREPAAAPRTLTPTADMVKKVYRNARGERVDGPLKYHFSHPLCQEIKEHKMCNYYHLTGYCYRNDSCPHKHGEKLSPERLEALRTVARMAPCQYGLDCEDGTCTSGHRCTRDNCQLSFCRFSKEMHNVDTRIVTTTQVK